MNNALTGLGLALVLALVAALIGPWFIDWNAYRDDFAAQASALVGAPVTVSGDVDARLLPSPYVRFRGVAAGVGDARLEASEIEITLAIGPLLRGEAKAERLKLVRPVLNLASNADGVLTTPFGAGARGARDADRISFDRAEIVDGALRLATPSGRLTLTNIDGVAEAGSLRGPFRFEGAATTTSGQAAVRLSTAKADDFGVIRLKLAASLDGRPETFDLDGALTIAAKPHFEGQVAAARPETKSEPKDGKTTIDAGSWRLTAKVAGDAARLAFDSIDAAYGPEERGLRLAGKGALILGATPRVDLAVGARQLDLDRFAGADRPKTPLGVIEWIAGQFAGAARQPLPGRIAIDVGGVVLAGDVARNLSAELVANEDVWRVARASVWLPGDASLAASGALVFVDREPGFAGKVDFTAGDVASLRRWLQGGAGEGARTAVRRLSVKGDVSARMGGLAVDNARIEGDGAVTSGRLAWRAAEEGERAALEARLTADKLDLDALGADRLVAGLIRGADTDVAVTLDAKALTLLGVSLRDVALDAALDADGFEVRRLAVADAGGAKLSGQGRIGAGAEGPEGRLAFDVDAQRLDGLIAFARAVDGAGGAADVLARRAAALQPAKATVELTTGAAGHRVTARGNAAGGAFEARLSTPRFALDADMDMALDLGSPDGRRLAALVGLTTSPVAAAEGGRLTLALKGAPARGMTGDARFAALGLDLAAKGDVTLAPVVGLSAAADVTLKSPDIAAFAEALGRLTPGVAPSMPVDLAARVAVTADQAAIENLAGSIAGRAVSGRLLAPFDPKAAFEGEAAVDEAPAAALLALGLSPEGLTAGPTGVRSVWPSAAFGPSPLRGLNGRIAVSARRMPLGLAEPATDVRFILALRPNATSVERFSANLAGGGVTGSLDLSRPGLEATLAVKAAAKDVRLERLTGQGVASKLIGAIEGTVEAQGSGRSLSAIMASFAGAGSATLRSAAIRSLDAAALDAVEPMIEQGLPLEAPKIAGALEPLIGRADFTAPRLGAPFTISGGVLRSGAIVDEGVAARLGGGVSIDLSRLTLDAALTLGPRRADAPQLGVAFQGSLAAPRRKLDATALTSWLSVRAVERETQRIEAMEAEIQQRARLARERAAAEDRRRAEEKRVADEKRKADEERLKAQQLAPSQPTLPPTFDLAPPTEGETQGGR
ncbi:AsmA family protein [Methylopila sp. 73B]|uniref:AsmA family protein n=1 Tax=Methylopila sp. 73B TaxID=1120792 RepID=UPI000381C766|nr:AsmA family protein [Methylopila sp. 73B]